jgi:galactan endo-1,6-beta-galactosidase
MLQKARDRGANRFELFPNAPMWWMCANDNPSGRASKTEDNLSLENYDAFATYLATIARVAKDRWGITFTTVEPFNEPISGWWVENGKQEGCYFSPEAQAAFLPHLRAALDRMGLRDMPIAASDETSFSDALRTWRSFPESVKALVNQVNVHGYEGAKGPRAELHAAVAKGGKPLWNSEHGDKIADGLDMARELMLDFQQLQPVAWCYWQALDGGNNGGWGLLGADLTKKTIGRANPKFFVLAQFTRHIRPGMTILGTGDADVVATFDARARRLVLVLRGGREASTKEIDLAKFHAPDQAVESWITEPKAGARYEKRPGLRVERGRLLVPLPADSIQTLEVANATP